MTTIKIPVEDGTSLPAYLARPATDPAPVAVIVAHELVSYPGVGHAFFWPGTPPFSREAREDAWRRIVELLAS